MKSNHLGILVCLLMLAGCANNDSPNLEAGTSTQNAASQMQAVKLTPQQELAKYCRVCVLDKGEKMEEYLPTRLDTKHKGNTYKFCMDDCKKKFGAKPAKYALK